MQKKKNQTHSSILLYNKLEHPTQFCRCFLCLLSFHVLQFYRCKEQKFTQTSINQNTRKSRIRWFGTQGGPTGFSNGYSHESSLILSPMNMTLCFCRWFLFPVPRPTASNPVLVKLSVVRKRLPPTTPQSVMDQYFDKTQNCTFECSSNVKLLYILKLTSLSLCLSQSGK